MGWQLLAVVGILCGAFVVFMGFAGRDFYQALFGIAITMLNARNLIDEW